MTTTTTDTTESWERSLREREAAHVAELRDLLTIPSVSTDPERQADVARAAEWVADRLRAAGVPTVEVLATGGHPVVYGDWPAGADRPTVLIYGHYDVQPAEPLELWQTPPFEPTERDGKLYARGSSDMKGNLLTAVQGVEALARAGSTGAPPVNVRFIFEGEEEIGSPNLAPFVRAERDRLACDVVLCADGGQYAADRPSLDVSTKGLAGCQIDLRTAAGDLHSGMYGAVVPNAVQALAQLLATFHDDEGRVAVAGFYDAVRDLTAEERAEIAAVPFDEGEYRAQAGVEALRGEPGYAPLERAWLRPTLDLNGVWGGFQGEGNKTVTPCEAHAKVTCRLVPDQEPEAILDLIERHVAAHCPPGATATVTRLPGSARPWAVDRGLPALAAAGKVLAALWGAEPVVIRSGGTIPVLDIFKRELGADTVLFAWSLPGSGAHVPNEWYRLEDFYRGRRAYAALLSALANMSKTSEPS